MRAVVDVELHTVVVGGGEHAAVAMRLAVGARLQRDGGTYGPAEVRGCPKGALDPGARDLQQVRPAQHGHDGRIRPRRQRVEHGVDGVGRGRDGVEVDAARAVVAAAVDGDPEEPGGAGAAELEVVEVEVECGEDRLEGGGDGVRSFSHHRSTSSLPLGASRLRKKKRGHRAHVAGDPKAAIPHERTAPWYQKAHPKPRGP